MSELHLYTNPNEYTHDAIKDETHPIIALSPDNNQ